MPTVQIPLFSPIYRNVNEMELADENFRLIDAYQDAAGFVRSRPALRHTPPNAFFANARPLGMFWWEEANAVLTAAIAFALTDGPALIVYGGQFVDGELDTSFNFGAANHENPLVSDAPRASIVANDTYAFAAAGGPIVYGNSSTSAQITDADAPTRVTHLAYMDGYLICNERGTNRFHWANVNAPTDWGALNFASAAGSPDIIVGLMAHNREILLFGDGSFERWENDGETPFIRIVGGFYNVGCIAPYSPTRHRSDIYWLDDQRKLVRFRAGDIEPVYTPFDNEIRDFQNLENVTFQVFDLSGRPHLAMRFPNDGRFLVGDINSFESEKGSQWSEFAHWDSSIGNYRGFAGHFHCYAPAFGMDVMQASPNVGNSYAKFTPNFYEDYFPNPIWNGLDQGGPGDAALFETHPIRPTNRTGHLDFGTSKRKRMEWLRFRTRRGVGLPDLAVAGTPRVPKLIIRWRDDGRQEWSNEVEISLGNQGEYETIRKIPCRGVFETRQFEFYATDPVPLALGRAEADITVLR